MNYSQTKINKGLQNLLEKKLSKLKEAISQGKIENEVVEYNDIERIAKIEGIKVGPYHQEKERLMEEYYKK